MMSPDYFRLLLVLTVVILIVAPCIHCKGVHKNIPVHAQVLPTNAHSFILLRSHDANSGALKVMRISLGDDDHSIVNRNGERDLNLEDIGQVGINNGQIYEYNLGPNGKLRIEGATPIATSPNRVLPPAGGAPPVDGPKRPAELGSGAGEEEEGGGDPKSVRQPGGPRKGNRQPDRERGEDRDGDDRDRRRPERGGHRRDREREEEDDRRRRRFERERRRRREREEFRRSHPRDGDDHTTDVDVAVKDYPTAELSDASQIGIINEGGRYRRYRRPFGPLGVLPSQIGIINKG